MTSDLLAKPSRENSCENSHVGPALAVNFVTHIDIAGVVAVEELVALADLVLVLQELQEFVTGERQFFIEEALIITQEALDIADGEFVGSSLLIVLQHPHSVWLGTGFAILPLQMGKGAEIITTVLSALSAGPVLLGLDDLS